MNNSLDLTTSSVFDISIEKGKTLNKYFTALVATGDTYMPFQFAAYSGATLTVKKSPSAYNSLQLTTAGSIVLMSDGVFRLNLPASGTEINTGTYVYSMTLFGTGTTKVGFLRGRFNIIDESYGEVPNDNSDSPIQIVVKPNYVYVESVLNYISGATNLGSGQGVFSGVSNKNLQLRSIQGVNGISVTGSSTTIGIGLGISPTTGATNIGSGQGIYSTILNKTLQLKTLTGTNGISISGGTNSVGVYLNLTPITGATNLGSTGQGLYTSTTNKSIQLKKVRGGNSISVSGDSTSIQVSFTGVSTTVTGATNGLSVSARKLKLGGTLTGTTAIVGTTANTLTFRVNNILNTTTGAFILTNDQDATVGVQQFSPTLLMRSRGWATTGSVSRTVDYYLQSTSVQGSTPTGIFKVLESVNNAAPSSVLEASLTNGVIATAGVLASPGAVALNLNAGGGSMNLKVNGSTTVMSFNSSLEVNIPGYVLMPNNTSGPAGTPNGALWVSSGQFLSYVGGANVRLITSRTSGGVGSTAGLITFQDSFTGGITSSANFGFASSILSLTGKQAITQGVGGIALAIANNSQSFSAHLDATIKQTGSITGAAITGAEFAALGVHTTMVTAANTDQKLHILDARPTLTFNGTTAVGYGINFTPTTVNGTQVATATVRAWNHSVGAIVWGSVLSGATLSTNQNNYDPNGLTNASAAPYGATALRLKSTSGVTITGIAGGVHGRVLVVINANAAGGSTVTLSADDGSTSTAANRFATAISITAGIAKTIFYDGYSSRWRQMS